MRIRGKLCETGEVVTVTLAGDRITAVAPDAGPVDLGGDDLWLAPAFIDLQVNGYGGHDFNLAPLGEESDGASGASRRSAPVGRAPAPPLVRGAGSGASRTDGLAEVARAIVDLAARAGTAMLCPTICTNSPEAMRSALAGLARACEEDRRLARALPAFHVEGPFIATEDGPRGAHPREWVRDPDWDEFQAMQEAAGGRIRILTLAPEREGSLPFIERVSASGVVVSLGHTGATPEQIRDAVHAGARMSTHLGNGAHAQLPRHPNYIWEQLAADAMWGSVIADGHHLPPAVVKCMGRAKGPDRLCLVSDAVALGGQPPGIYNEGRHEVLPSGKVVLAGTPYLAGAGHLLDTCVANAVRFTGWGLGDVVRAATENPAAILGIDAHVGRVAPGMDAHLTLFRLPEEGPLEVEATVRAGEVVWQTTDEAAFPRH